jgi:hypothetical protein
MWDRTYRNVKNKICSVLAQNSVHKDCYLEENCVHIWNRLIIIT